ncbi:unnamed protein product [Blepharisma stoltei]|uniref:Uncharacterized protein n=1 Tax=Blepharisma stoltei TaxID=1481888 RepID=A0AAU9ITI4_9CILI|nr:unnamed protein product [Blepharisma stoltei]
MIRLRLLGLFLKFKNEKQVGLVPHLLPQAIQIDDLVYKYSTPLEKIFHSSLYHLSSKPKIWQKFLAQFFWHNHN